MLLGIAVSVAAQGCLVDWYPVRYSLPSAARPGRFNHPLDQISGDLVVRLAPSRHQGVFAGADVEFGPWSHLEASSARLTAGYIRLPRGQAGTLGQEIGLLAGYGQPISPRDGRGGPGYTLGGAAALAVVLLGAASNLEDGYVVGGYSLELMVDLRAGMWFAEGPPSPIQCDFSMGVGLRVRAFSDLAATGGTHYRRAQ